MDERLKEIRDIIKKGDADTAIHKLTKLIASESQPGAESYYLLGNAFRKKGDWQGALNNYQEAISIDPSSPASSARNMVMDILNFYNKDMFNQ